MNHTTPTDLVERLKALAREQFDQVSHYGGETKRYHCSNCRATYLAFIDHLVEEIVEKAREEERRGRQFMRNSMRITVDINDGEKYETVCTHLTLEQLKASSGNLVEIATGDTLRKLATDSEIIQSLSTPPDAKRDQKLSDASGMIDLPNLEPGDFEEDAKSN